VKDENINNVHLNGFHINPVIFEILMKLTIRNNEEAKSFFWENHWNGQTYLFRGLAEFDPFITWQQFHWLAKISAYTFFEPWSKNLNFVKYWNFIKLHKTKFNLEFNETSVIRVPVTIYYLKRISFLKILKIWI